MSEETVVAPKSTVFVERKISVRQYESLTVAIHYPVDFPIRLEDDTDESYSASVRGAIGEAFFTAKAIVFEQAGVEYEDRNGVMVEKVAKMFEGAAEVVPQRPTAPASPPAEGMPSSCPACGGDKLYDNRAKKASGQYKSNAPDFKCADKGCGKGIWADKK